MKRSWVVGANGERIACDAVIALLAQPVQSEVVQGGKKVAIVASTAAGFPVLEVCFPHEVQARFDGWTQAIFGGERRMAGVFEQSERKVVLQ